ncbi:UNVERIFIED_CONTAM: ATP sulfurylase 2 [Sesamum latifolium]|uniref:ATP sulfurylase 2 n=1 Tax=Sesamum latifolium TaxID=2727402 RepID=A0AAW2TKZ4_9LAMI
MERELPKLLCFYKLQGWIPLVDLIEPANTPNVKNFIVEALSKVVLTKIDLEWDHEVSEGWASPLKGLLRETENLGILHFNCLWLKDENLVDITMLTVLTFDDEVMEKIGGSCSVALVG